MEIKRDGDCKITFIVGYKANGTMHLSAGRNQPTSSPSQLLVISNIKILKFI